MAAVRLRMRPVCERHRGERLLRVRMRARGNGPGRIVRALTRVRRKIKLVRRRIQVMRQFRIEQALIIAR
jgi:hypothetical protein